MNKGTVSFLLAMALFVIMAVTWAKVGGLAQAYQESNVKVWAERELRFVSPNECQACHNKIAAALVGAQHKSVNCQTCHGPAGKHLQGEGKPSIDSSRQFCATCHNKIIGRRADFPTVDVETHNAQAPSCSLCHNPHAPGLKG